MGRVLGVAGRASHGWGARAGGHGRRRIAGALVIAWIALVAACSGLREDSEPVGLEEVAVEVEVTPVWSGEIAERIAAPGTLVARRESRIGAQVQGRIERVFVEEGDRVAAGDPLFQIDSEPFLLDARRAEADLQWASAERRQAEVDLARAQALAERQVVAQRELDRLATAVAVALAREHAARETLALARLQLERTQVRAPYAGSIAARFEDEGTTALVQPQTIVVVLKESHDLEVHAAIPEARSTRVRVGDAVRVHVEGLAMPIETRVSATSDVVDPATRTYKVRARIDNGDHQLRPGGFALVEVFPRARSDVTLVPRDALRSEAGRSRVLAVRNGRAIAEEVVLGAIADDVAELVEGPEAGTLVVVGPSARKLAPGMRVRVSRVGGQGG